MTKCWLLTWTTYGTWLPGDERGFVSPVQDESGKRVIHNIYETPYDADMPKLRAYAARIQRQETVWLTQEQADATAKQFHETAIHRNWRLHVFAIMANHVHVVVEASEQVPGEKLLGDFKSYSTRCLRALAGNPRYIPWTEKGSKRLLPNEQAVEDAITYVQHQPKALVVYVGGMTS